MRARFYGLYVIRSLARGGQRTLLAICCVAVGVLALVALQLVGNMVDAGLTGSARAANGGDLAVSSDFTPFSPQDVAPFARLKAQGILTNYTGVAVHDGQTTTGQRMTAFFEVMAVDPEAFPLGGGLKFVSPSDRRLAALLVDTNVVVTQNLLMALHAQVGDPITVHSAGRSFTGGIAGVLKNAGLFSYQEIMLIAWRGFAALPGGDAMPLGYQTVYADVPGHGASAADLAKRRIQDAIPTARISTTGDASRQNEESVRLVRYFLQIVGLLALFIGGGGVITTM